MQINHSISKDQNKFIMNPKVDFNLKKYKIRDYTKPDFLKVSKTVHKHDPTVTRSVLSR